MLKRVVPRDLEVHQVRPVRPLSSVLIADKHVVPRRKQRQHDERQKDDQVVERKDAERAASVEAGEVALAVAGADENTGDQESGQHEKDVHARPSEQDEERRPRFRRRMRVENRVVVQQDEDDGDAANAIKSGRVRKHVRSS